MRGARRALLWALALVALLVAGLGVVYVPSGTVAILSWRDGGTPEILDPGLAYRVPLLQRVERFPGGVIALEGSVDVASREGHPVALPFELTLRTGHQEFLELHREGGAGGVAAGLRRLVEARLERAAVVAGTYDLAAGLAQETLGRALRRGLEDRFGPGVRVEVDPAVLSAEVRALFDRQAIGALRREGGVRVLLLGLDGADWDFIDPMIARGELPHLARLKREGAWSRLRSSTPTLSPLLWTTVATGKTPDRHGINDFLVADPRTGSRVPINSTFRRAKALWNILTEMGLQADFIAWWATWPAEPIAGHLISDRVAYSTFDISASPGQRGAVYPAEYALAVETLRLHEDTVSYHQVARFLNISEREFRAARAARDGERPATEAQESINLLVRVLASTETYRKVALDLLERRSRDGAPADLFAVYFQGIDEVNHRFAHCAPPRAPLCSDGDFSRFGGAVAAFYRYQDEILGEILERDPGATVLAISDHGFASDSGRPDDVKPFIEGKPGLWHDLRGIFVARGESIQPGEVPLVTLYDIAPTVLHLLGLPVPDDMPGEVLEAALSPRFASAHEVARIPSYEWTTAAEADEEGSGGTDGGEALAGAADAEIMKQLQALGYVGDEAPSAGTGAAPTDGGAAEAAPEVAPGREVPTLLYYVNLGGVYMGRRQFELAEAEFRKALRIDPSYPQAIAGLAMLHEARGEPERALELFRTLIRLERGDDLATLTRMAGIFIRMGRVDDGLAYMEGIPPRAQEGARGAIGRWVAIGLLQMAAGRLSDAEGSFLKALEIDPASQIAMQELFALYDAQGRSVRLEPKLREALALEPRSGMHHNWLGLVLRRRGDLAGAESQFREALEVAPDLTGTMANLGSLLLQQGRIEDAIATLRGALEKERRNVESRVNLIVALGMQGDLRAARQLLEESLEMGLRAPHLHNALAYALHVNGRTEAALRALDEAQTLDPRHPDSIRLRAEIEAGRTAQGLPYR